MLLRIPPFRGAQVAAGVVVLTVLVLLLELRMTWSPAGHLAAVAAVAVPVWVLLAATPPAEGRARPWLSALCLSAVGLLAVALGHVIDILGGDGFYGGADPGDVALGGLVVGVAATWCLRARGAASCALIAGLAGTTALLAGAEWVGDPSDRLLRWLLLASAVVLLVLTLAHRDRRHLVAAQFANAGGLAVAAIALPTVLGTAFALVLGGPDARPDVAPLATGWEIVLMAAGFGMLAYGAVDGERGPVVVGVIDLALFVASTMTPHDDLVGWPLFLLLAGAAFLVIGLRPTTPAPPEPGIDVEPLPPVDVRPLR